MKIAVIGGGISGLAAAWELKGKCDVTVFEKRHLGGCIRTSTLANVVVEDGPDAFLTRTADGVQLANELGLDSMLISPEVSEAAGWWEQGLARFPENLVLGAPSQLSDLLRSKVISRSGIARAALDLVMPRSAITDSDTVYELVARRFGREVAETLVGPLVGSIHAGSISELSAAETVPQLVLAAQGSRSLLRGLRSARLSRPAGPTFLAPRDGLGALVAPLIDQLRKFGVNFITDRVLGVGTAGSARVVLEPSAESFDGVVIALPPSQASKIFSSPLSDRLLAIPMASVVMVNAVIRRGSVPPDLSGFLVPESRGCLLTACSFASNKWPTRASPDHDVVRLSAGRSGDERAFQADDQMVADRLLDELEQALRQEVSVHALSVSRWPASFPQYLPGHAQRVRAIRNELHRLHPRIRLAGAGYEGTGIPGCISLARRAARSLLAPSERQA